MPETGREAVGPEGEDRRRSDAVAHVLLSPREETRVRHGLPWYVMDYITYYSWCLVPVWRLQKVAPYCIIFFWSSGIMECTCMLFTFENGVPLMR